MHKKMLRVSERVAAAGSPPAAVDALLRGQANDAYWHGVFGGVYLPHLRRAVWENLLGNAWKFTSKREPALIEVGSTRVDGQRAYFVRDNGAGFDSAGSSKLFAPFQRLHARSEFDGTGIGLATVQRIVQRHGGAVRAEGVPDHGTTVFFSLPEAGDVG